MTTYTKATDFLAKDSLPLNNAAKYVKGSEIDTEFDAIETADADNMKKSAMGTGVETFLGTPSSANLAAAVTGETGTGALVFATSPTLVTPALGTPASGTLTNCTGLPVSTGVSGLGANVAAFLATPSSANLAAAVTDETGSGALVLATSPTLVTPVLGVAAATSINKLAITAPATSATLAIADGKTLTVSNTMTLTGTDSTSYNLDSANSVTLKTAVQTTSGTEAAFTAIPSTAKRIAVSMDAVGTSDGADLEMQLGDSGGYEATDYYSTYSYMANGVYPVVASANSTKFDITYGGSASNTWSGVVYLEKIEPDGWAMSGTLSNLQGGIIVFSGHKYLSATLDRLKVFISSGTFNGGSIALSYTT